VKEVCVTLLKNLQVVEVLLRAIFSEPPLIVSLTMTTKSSIILKLQILFYISLNLFTNVYYFL